MTSSTAQRRFRCGRTSEAVPNNSSRLLSSIHTFASIHVTHVTSPAAVCFALSSRSGSPRTCRSGQAPDVRVSDCTKCGHSQRCTCLGTSPQAQRVSASVPLPRPVCRRMSEQSICSTGSSDAPLSCTSPTISPLTSPSVERSTHERFAVRLRSRTDRPTTWRSKLHPFHPSRPPQEIHAATHAHQGAAHAGAL